MQTTKQDLFPFTYGKRTDDCSPVTVPPRCACGAQLDDPRDLRCPGCEAGERRLSGRDITPW